MTGRGQIQTEVWRPQRNFTASLLSPSQLRAFNDTGGIAVYLDVNRSIVPQIEIVGSQTETISFWQTRSASGFISKPKFADDLVTIRFITSGHVEYRRKCGGLLGSPTHATLAAFEDLEEVRASEGLNAISATISVQTLARAHCALHEDDSLHFPSLAPVADMTAIGMKALYHTFSCVQHQILNPQGSNDLLLPLMQEIMSYQMLAVWPKLCDQRSREPKIVSSRNIKFAIDFIEANLSHCVSLADVANAAGIGVRSLQDKFRTEIGQTPIQYIIGRRLQQVHQDLQKTENANLSVSTIAQNWGFVHVSDFGQRYKAVYGHTPTETRRVALAAIR